MSDLTLRIVISVVIYIAAFPTLAYLLECIHERKAEQEARESKSADRQDGCLAEVADLVMHLEGLECPNCMGTFLEVESDDSIRCVMCGGAFMLVPQHKAVKVFDYTEWFIEHFSTPDTEDERSYSNE